MNKFLHSEVNLLIQHIIVQDQDGETNNKTNIIEFKTQNRVKYKQYTTLNLKQSIKFLGVMLDDTLKWKDHIQYVASSLINKFQNAMFSKNDNTRNKGSLL